MGVVVNAQHLSTWEMKAAMVRRSRSPLHNELEASLGSVGICPEETFKRTEGH